MPAVCSGLFVEWSAGQLAWGPKGAHSFGYWRAAVVVPAESGVGNLPTTTVAYSSNLQQ